MKLDMWFCTTQCGPTGNYTFNIFNNLKNNLVHQNILNMEDLRSTKDSLRPLSEASSFLVLSFYFEREPSATS